MVQVTGIEGLGQSLLDRQDEGFRKARRRNRRSRALETGLNLALSLGDGIFKRKYENFLKTEPVMTAQRLAKRNTALRSNFDNVQTQATAQGLSVPDYLAKQLETRYDDGYFSKFIPRWNEKTSSGKSWLSPEDKTTLRRDIINQSLFGKDYAKADFKPENATEGLYGNYLNAKRMLTAKPGEDFESSQELFDAIKEANPNAKSMGDGIIRLITERGVTKDDRRASSEAVIQSNSKTLKERNTALQLFNDGLGVSDSLKIAKKAEAINNRISQMPARKISSTPEDATVYDKRGNKLVIKQNKVVYESMDEGTYTLYENNMSHDLTRRYIEEYGDTRPLKTTKTVTNLLGDQVEIESININGVVQPIGTELKKLAYNFDSLNTEQKAKFELFFSQGAVKTSKEVRDIINQYMAPDVSNTDDASLSRDLIRQKTLSFKVNSVVLGNLLKDAGLFTSVLSSNSDRTALATSMLSVDLGQTVDDEDVQAVKLSNTDPLSKLLSSYNASVMKGQIPSAASYEGVTLNPFLVIEGLDRYTQAGVDMSTTDEAGRTKKELLVSELSDNVFGGDLVNIRKSFEKLDEAEKQYILDTAQKSVRENVDSLFNDKGIEGFVSVDDDSRKRLAKAGFNVELGAVDAKTVPLGFILLGKDFLPELGWLD